MWVPLYRITMTAIECSGDLAGAFLVVEKAEKGTRFCCATEDGEVARDGLSANVCRIVESADFVVDLHEGWGFHRKNPASMGSGLYPNRSRVATRLSYDIQRGMNESVVVMKSADDAYKRFVVEVNKHPQLKSLKGFCEWKGIPYILVETSGQNDIQPMDVRKRQHLYVMRRVFAEFQMM